MRRTKEWWARLTAYERRELVSLESHSYGNYGAGGYLPDDCSECPGCGEPMLGSGYCPFCIKRIRTLIAKGDGKNGR